MFLYSRRKYTVPHISNKKPITQSAPKKRIRRASIIGPPHRRPERADLPVEFEFEFEFPHIPTFLTFPEENLTIVDMPGTKKLDKLDNYVNEMTTIRSDTQNVHDSQLNAGLISIYAGLKKYEHVDREEIAKYIDAQDIAEQQKTDALRALQTFNLDAAITSIESNLYHVLATAWLNGYKDAVVRALSDCVERDEVVCVTGRANRVLYEISLDMNDKILTTDAYKSQIIHEIQNLMREKIREAENDTRTARQLVGRSYSDPNIVVDPAEEDTFKDELKKTISDYIVANYEGVLKPDFLKKMEDYCQAAVL